MSSKHRRISTIIPLYLDNGMPISQFFSCLDSISMQIHQPYEVIVSDDSFNSNEEIIREYASQNRLNVRYLRNPAQRGMGSNSNFALANARGDLVHILHSDDCLAHSKVYSELMTIDFNVYKWALLPGNSGRGPEVPNLDHMNILGINTIGGPSCVVAPTIFYAKYDTRLHLLVDLEQYSRMNVELGTPFIGTVNSINYGSGPWQVQRQIQFRQIRDETLIIVSKYSDIDYLPIIGSTLPIKHKVGVASAFHHVGLESTWPFIQVVATCFKESVLDSIRFFSSALLSKWR